MLMGTVALYLARKRNLGSRSGAGPAAWRHGAAAIQASTSGDAAVSTTSNPPAMRNSSASFSASVGLLTFCQELFWRVLFWTCSKAPPYQSARSQCLQWADCLALQGVGSEMADPRFLTEMADPRDLCCLHVVVTRDNVL